MSIKYFPQDVSNDWLAFYEVGALVKAVIITFLIFHHIDKRKMLLVIFPSAPISLMRVGVGFVCSISTVNHPPPPDLYPLLSVTSSF